METMLERKAVPYNLRDPQKFLTQRSRTVNYGLETLINRFRKSWALVSDKHQQNEFFKSA